MTATGRYLQLVPRALLLWLLILAAVPAAQAAGLRAQRLDDLRDASPWRASASDQVRAALRRDADGSLCLDVDFNGVSGYGVMRRELPLDWPAHFELVVRLKGGGAVNDLQIKVVDAGGDNVWWVRRPEVSLPNRLQALTLRSRHFEFAWGPATDRQLRRTQHLEFVIAASREGGRSHVCVAGITLQPRAPDPQPWPPLQVRRALPGEVQIDAQVSRELNGLAIRWPAGVRVPDYDLQALVQGRWRTWRQVRGSDGGLDALFLPEHEARQLRLRSRSGLSLPLPQVALRDAAQWPHPNSVLAELSADAPRGDLPRAFRGEQNYWTLVGVDGGGARSALLSEDGALEVGRGGFSVEPSLRLQDGSRVTWASASLRQDLREGYLPIPRVLMEQAGLRLEVEAAADGTREAPWLLARYRVTNTQDQPRRVTLMLAVRPWQVNPPQQFLSTQGGLSPIGQLQRQGGSLWVNDRWRLDPTGPAQRVTALPFDGGLSLAALEAAPALTRQTDPQSQASAALAYDFELPPRSQVSVGWTAALVPHAAGGVPTDMAALDRRFEAVADHWRERLNRSTLQLPGGGQRLADTLRSSLAHMLISREGAMLRPATRSYNRTWIRDAAMMIAGLVRLGEADAAREFVDAFAPHIFASGKVPCCVDARGADPVVENDSHGQYLFSVAEVWRHTGDRAFLQRHWPTVQRVMAWTEALRQSERTAANEVPGRRHLYGLMPPSISHEGYSDRPAYAYWDNFWALRGYKDAVQIAQVLGQAEPAAAWAQMRDGFESELALSISATAAHHGVNYIAGAADRGDFDATSITMALNPTQANVPAELLRSTFDRYWEQSVARAGGRSAYKDYTPYEWRNVGALARLGHPERAHAMMDFFFRDQRPAGWNQWAEVVVPDPREVRFLGDMPHAWVSSDFVRSALDLLVWEREADDALVVGSGLIPAWLTEGEGLVLRGLSTPYGAFDLAIRRRTDGWTLELPKAMKGLHGGVRLRWPAALPRPRATHAGRELVWSDAGELPLPEGPTVVELRSVQTP